jgi:hypothetical protein
MEKGELLKLFQEWGEGRKWEKIKGVNPSVIYLIHYKNFCKCHNVPSAQQ